MEWAHRVVPGSLDQDRVLFARTPSRLLLVLADGAGGSGSGSEAADLICQRCQDILVQDRWPNWCAVLTSLDYELAALGAQSTAIVMEVANGIIQGASVGDSEAWLQDQDSWMEWTAGQRRKPLLGSASAQPIALDPRPAPGRLLLASDGLMKYAPRKQILQTAAGPVLSEVLDQLVSLVRLPSGGLQADVSILVVEL